MNNVERIRALVKMVKATFPVADNADVAETKKTYELIKEGCEKNANFKRGVELYLMEYALHVHDSKEQGPSEKTFDELLKELKL